MEFWVADLRQPAIRLEAQRQARAIAASPREADDQAFIDAASEAPGG